MTKKHTYTLLLLLLLPLLVGIISAAFSAKGMAVYGNMNKPPLSPPSWVFPVAWTILYLLMGFASYIIVVSEAPIQNTIFAILLYGIQLFMNFFWSIIFFRWGNYSTAFLWLVILWGIVIFCTFRFYDISKKAGYLMVPYVLWLTFAAYLNLGAYFLNGNGTI